MCTVTRSIVWDSLKCFRFDADSENETYGKSLFSVLSKAQFITETAHFSSETIPDVRMSSKSNQADGLGNMTDPTTAMVHEVRQMFDIAFALLLSVVIQSTCAHGHHFYVVFVCIHFSEIRVSEHGG